MNKSDVINKARELREAGKTEEQITATLVNLGISEDEAGSIIEESKKEPIKPQRKEKVEESEKSSKASPKKKKSWWPF